MKKILKNIKPRIMFSFIKKNSSLFLITAMLFSCIHAGAQNLNTPNKEGPLGTEVNTFSGNLHLPRTDVYVPSRGLDINLRFFYNSFYTDNNYNFGKGWTSSYSIIYKNDTLNGKIIMWGDGREDSYKANGTAFTSQNGIFDELTQYQPGKYLIKQTDGMKYFFDNSVLKKVTRMEDANGNFLNFAYTDTLLTTITNTMGQSITLAYNPAGNLSTVTDAIVSPVRMFSYQYDASNNLTQVTDPAGGKMKYAYLVNGPIKSITDMNHNVVDIIYYQDYSVSELIGCNKRLSFSYDTTLNITTATDYMQDGSARVTKYTYARSGDFGFLTALSGNCCGYEMSFAYDAAGNKIKQTDANGNITKYTYDSKGNPLTITDPLGQTVTYTYTADLNQVSSYKDQKGNIYALTYDTRGNILQVTEPDNKVYAATYNSSGDILTSTDPLGHVYTYNYDAAGHPVGVTGPNGFTANITINGRGNITSYTDANGHSGQYEFDSLNRIKKIIDPLNNNMQFTYDANGNVINIKNKNGETRIMKYDASNRTVEVKDELGKSMYATYDAMDNITSITDENGNSSTYTYDTRNRLSAATNALGESFKLNYDAKQNMIGLISAEGRQISFTYDALDRLKTAQDLNGSLLQISYDGNNNVTSYTKGTGSPIQAEYDSRNRITKITDESGNSEQYNYDNDSRITSVIDRNGKTFFLGYDALDRIITITDKNGFVTTATYDAQGNITALKDADNHTTSYVFDNMNRMTRTTYPDGRFINLTYDAKGNIILKKLADGTNIIYAYDSLNRIKIKTLPDGNVYNYTYDAKGRVVAAGNNAGTVTIAYDHADRVLSETYNGRTVNYAYNISGRTQTILYPDNTTITKAFDTRNRLSVISKNGIPVASYQYNNNNKIISKTAANGVTTSMQYNSAGLLIGYTTGNNIQHANISYDNEKNKTVIERPDEPAKSQQYSFDNNHRLTGYKRGIIGNAPVVQNTYSYDAAGNRSSLISNSVTTSYVSDNLNRITNSNNGSQNINFTFDNNGNLTYDGKYYKTYNAEGQLLKDSASPSTVITYKYDAFGRRTQKNIFGNILNYTFAGGEQIEELDNTGNIRNRTVFSNFLTPVLNEKNNVPFYYHQNDLNSVEAISNAQGRAVEKYEYDVYGKQTIYDSSGNLLPGSQTGNRFGFTGQQYDSATASNKFLFREYNPETGTFNERDLIGYADGMGMYQYVHDNPANGIDIFGLLDPDCDDPLPIFTPKQQQNGTDWANRMQWWSSNGLSNVNSVTFIMEGNGIVKMLGNGNVVANQFRNPVIKALNSAGVGKYLAGVNILAAKQATSDFVDMVASGTAGAGQISDAAIGVGSSYTFAGMSIYSTVGGVNSVAAGGTFNAGFTGAISATGAGFFVVAGAGGLAIFGVTNEITRAVSGKSIAEHGEDMEIPIYSGGFRVLNGGNYEPDPPVSHDQHWRPRIINCPNNNNPGGPRKRKYFVFDQYGDSTEVVQSGDPNAIIGPDGQPNKHWVSVKDRLPYTILFENSKAASAPAKFVRVTTQVEPKEDANTFELSNFGFNNQTFTVPNNTASYYQRIDARDSLGIFVDFTAGYDQVGNKIFWEFQSIDPITLLPPADPLKGFLLLQDSSKGNNGHAFVNFSIKPKTTDVTLDTIGQKAVIVFDANDSMSTNIAKNTIDAFAPTSHMNALPATSNNPVSLSWSGVDDINGCGVWYYTLYASTDGVNFNIVRSHIQRTDTTFTGTPNTNYTFFVLATDSVGNTEVLGAGHTASTFIGSVVPVTWLHFSGITIGRDNILDWSTASEQNSKEFKVERSPDAVSFTAIGTQVAAGNSSTIRNYQYKDLNIDKLKMPVMYYRIKQIDLNGNFKYSNIVRLTYNATGIANSIVYPNPTDGWITVTVGDPKLIGTEAVMIDANGRQLEVVKITGNSVSIDLGKYVNGTYFIRLSNKEVLRVVKL